MSKLLISSNSKANIYEIIDQEGVKRILKESVDHDLLAIEARMLEYLSRYVRVPEVITLQDDRLVMEYINSGGSCNGDCESEIADALSALHRHSADQYGFAYDTTIGPFRQSNRKHDDWIDFYREERVLDFSAKAFDEKQIDRLLLKRIEVFAKVFEKYLQGPSKPSLLHGDIWSGNVLTKSGHLSAFIDPAIYYGHHEMELAFIGMFNTLGASFYKRYQEQLKVEDGFFEERAHIYRIFPYLVHVRAFGGSYLGGLEGILRRFGY